MLPQPIFLLNMYKEYNFNKVSRDYRDIHTKNISFTGAPSEYYTEYKVLNSLAIVNYPRGLNILDFGCGDGLASFYFDKNISDSHIAGIDISSESIDIAQKRNIPNVDFVNFDGRSLPYRDNSFDLIYVSCVFHHIDTSYHKSILKELYRVLKKGGSLHVYEHNPLNILTRYAVKTCAFDEDVELIWPHNLERMLESVGFSSHIRDYIFVFPRHPFLKKFHLLEPYLSKFPLGAQYLLVGKKV